MMQSPSSFDALAHELPAIARETRAAHEGTEALERFLVLRRWFCLPPITVDLPPWRAGR